VSSLEVEVGLGGLRCERRWMSCVHPLDIRIMRDGYKSHYVGLIRYSILPL
jgi:hypothetical protein